VTFQPNPESQWRKIQRVGLCPEITSFEVYTETYTKQLDKALIESVRFPNSAPGPEEILIFHRIIFKGIHPWAGTFRTAGESVHFDGGQVGADAVRIIPAIEQLQKATADRLLTAATPEEKVLAMVGYLGALRMIHPFRDGNTRTAVVILEGQTTALFGERERPALTELDFKQLLRDAYQGHLAPLANRILTREGLPALSESLSEAPRLRPALDPDMETVWQQQREEIVRKQRGDSPSK
jgi:fido (protein-threonine AMPylation protein)